MSQLPEDTLEFYQQLDAGIINGELNEDEAILALDLNDPEFDQQQEERDTNAELLVEEEEDDTISGG